MGNILIENILPPDEKVEVGKKALDFALPGNFAGDWRLSDHLGKVIALMFYPQNETLICTKQLCSIRDNWTDYLKTKALVVGISPGSVETHSEFAEKYNLPMPLLADEGRAITRIFGTHSWLPLLFTRAIVIIDAKGIIRDRKVMFRGFRPNNYTVLSSIYQAQTDISQDKFKQILDNHRIKKTKVLEKIPE